VARSIRTVAVAIAVALSVAGLTGTALVATAPPAAAATLSAPVVKLAFGDRSLTVAWGAVRGATSYVVQHSRTSTFSRPVSVDAGTKTRLFVKGLANRTTYYVRVVAKAGTSKAVSRTAKATPDAGYPRELTVTAVPAGKHAIRVSWTGQGRATKVAVIAGSEGSISRDVFRTGWYPATTTSVTVTVPPALRARLGTGSGNPVFVKVATYNSLAAGTSMPNVKNEAAAYRLSPAGTYAWAGATTPTGTRLRVATWNVNSVAATANLTGQTWRDRRTRVAAGIAYSNAAVVGTAELTTAETGAGYGLRQWEDLRNLLATPTYGGYAIANSVTSATTGGAPATTVGAHLFYKPSVVTREAGAFVSPKHALGLSWPATLTDRYFSWARFRVNATGARFYAVAVHLPANSGSTSYAALRAKEAAAIDAYMTARAGGLPILLMGDLNSSFAETPQGPDTVLVGRGYYDTSSAVKRAHPRVSTANLTNQVDNLGVRGYPTRPYVYRYAAPRIDYIFVKNAPGAWRYNNQLVLTDGRFDPRYRGSDHNLQWAEIGIP
jgi:endonuclease/exonuclease/phosphatase family metal-dependent hydrolase